MSQADFDTFIAELLNVWMTKLQQKLQSAIAAENLVNTGALQQSLRKKVFKGVLGATAQGQLDLNLYGRFLDIKRPAPMPTSSNTTNRHITGVSQKKNRGRSWYNKNVTQSKRELADLLMNDIGKMSKKDFLNWIQT
jgi:hypothetical protein